MVEMPGLPCYQLLAVDLDDAGTRSCGDDDDSGQAVAIGARNGVNGMLFERPENLAEFHLHGARLLDIPADDDTAVVQELLERCANLLIVQRFTGHTRHARAE